MPNPFSLRSWILFKGQMFSLPVPGNKQKGVFPPSFHVSCWALHGLSSLPRGLRKVKVLPRSFRAVDSALALGTASQPSGHFT